MTIDRSLQLNPSSCSVRDKIVLKAFTCTYLWVNICVEPILVSLDFVFVFLPMKAGTKPLKRIRKIRKSQIFIVTIPSLFFVYFRSFHNTNTNMIIGVMVCLGLEPRAAGW